MYLFVTFDATGSPLSPSSPFEKGGQGNYEKGVLGIMRSIMTAGGFKLRLA
jgi:hypothetical protein